MATIETTTLNSQDVDINLATPMMKQYLEIKRKNQNCILLYRMGDFYETFLEDAITVSRALEITLTHRSAGQLGEFPMAGVPAKAVDNYISKLLEQNYKVAICEQLEDPALTKDLVKRDVVRTITAGTITETNLLNAQNNNYLAAVIENPQKNLYGFAYSDISTGEFKATELNFNELLSELSRINPSEIIAPVIPQKVLPFQIVPEEKIDLPEEIVQNYNCSKIQPNLFSHQKAIDNLKKYFKITSLNAFGLENQEFATRATGAVLAYLCETQKGNLPRFDKIETYNISKYVMIDNNTRKNLELTQTVRDKSKYGSLLWAINKTKTNMGERLLKQWLNQPLKDINEIILRQNAVEEFLNNSKMRLYLAPLMEGITDIQRLSTKISNNTANARDFLSLKDSLKILPKIKELLNGAKSEYLNFFTEEHNSLFEFANLIEMTIEDNPPITLKEGGLIKKGVSGEIDYLKDLISGGEQWLKEFEEKEKEKTGIKFLKVGYSKTFGFFIEISNSNLNMVPDTYSRRQTLTNGERFITEELKKHEQEVLTAQSKSIELEYKIFSDFREYSKEFVEIIRKTAESLATLDVLLSFAISAIESKYIKPEITNQNDLYIKNGRHPVVEKILPMGKYVSNNLNIEFDAKDNSKTQFMVLTGPNMAGKSTYMRQNALIVILAQIGSYVPADEAKIGIVDKIFTRVGAVDDLSLGQSTFMVEMCETAFILNTATEKSFILLDEIGRGTSTYDGVAIAWAVAEHLITKVKARTIFATHYHELNVMSNIFPQAKNYRITIAEKDGHIEFLRKVIEGSASRSYGIEVAKMAGLPNSVVKSAESVMTKMQKDYSKDLSQNKKRQKQTLPDVPQLSLKFD